MIWNQSFFFTRTYSVDWEHAIKDKPVVLLVEEIWLCLNVLNRPVVLVEECKCTCAPSLKFWNRTLDSEWLGTDSKAFSWTVPNQLCYGNVYGLVINCKRHTCFVLTFVSPEPGGSLFFWWMNSDSVSVSVEYLCCIMVKSWVIPDVSWKSSYTRCQLKVHYNCHAITVKPKVNS